jgi:hypothetical protein
MNRNRLSHPLFAFLFASALFLSVGDAAIGQVIRLPTIRQYSSTSSVLVPDRGMALGSSSRFGNYGSRSSRGIGNRATGYGARGGGSSLSQSVTILDLNELDRAVLAAAEGRSLDLTDSTQGKTTRTEDVALLAQQIRSGNANSGFDLLRDIPSRRQTYRPAQSQAMGQTAELPVFQSRADDIRFYLREAQQAKSKGRWTVAQLFYEEAWERMSPEQQQQVLSYINRPTNANDATRKSSATPDKNSASPKANSTKSFGF